MKLAYLTIAVLFTVVESGYCLQCYSCVNSTGQLYSPTQCNSTQVSLTCAAPNDTCLDVRARFSNYTGKEAETELQMKACGTMEDCKRLGNETCTKTEGKCRYTCCQDDLCNNDSLARSLDALKCYHCEGPNGRTRDVFNHSTPLNLSYTARQCVNKQTKTYCPSDNRCARLHRVFRPSDSDPIEVERRSCISDEESPALQHVCNGTEHKVANRTSRCRIFVCADRDLCNLASCVHLAPFFVAFSTMFVMISIR